MRIPVSIRSGILKGKTTALAGPSGVGKSSPNKSDFAGSPDGDRSHQREDQTRKAYYQTFGIVLLRYRYLSDGYNWF